MSFKNYPTCCNAEPGTFGHECGKAAEYAGKFLRKHPMMDERPYLVFSFCKSCKEDGYESNGALGWTEINENKAAFTDGLTWEWSTYASGDWYGFYKFTKETS